MLLLKASHIRKYYGERLVLEFEYLSVYTGDKIGIVGMNGAGKSTLLNLLSGDLEPEEGQVLQYGTVSYAPQFSEAEDEAYGPESASSYASGCASSYDLKYDPKLLKEMNVSDKTEQAKVSGGEETRLRLAGAFGRHGHILLLDEPTANLDMAGSKLLQDKLARIETLLIISHDRALLDAVCTEIIEVSQGRLKLYPGNYSEYERLKAAEVERGYKEYEAYMDEKKRLEAVYLDKKKQARNMTKLPKGMSPREAHLRDFLCTTGRNHDGKQKNMNRAAEAVRKRINHMEVKEKPKEEQKIYLNFSLTNPPENKILMEGKDISFSYGSNVIFKNASFAIPNHTKVAMIGSNGAGKTTLVNLLKYADEQRIIKGDIQRYAQDAVQNDTKGQMEANQFIRYSGDIRIVPKAVIGCLYQKLENLEPERSVLENAMKDSIQTELTVRGILAGFLFRGDDICKKVSVLSGGEKMKLALAKLLVSKANVLLLDEPTNYLDMPSMITLQKRIKEYEGTVIFASHDRALINEAADALLLIENRGIIYYPGKLRQYEESHI